MQKLIFLVKMLSISNAEYSWLNHLTNLSPSEGREIHERKREKNVRASGWGEGLWKADFWTRHGYYIHQWTAAVANHKIKPAKILAWVRKRPWRLHHARGAIGSNGCWGRENHSPLVTWPLVGCSSPSGWIHTHVPVIDRNNGTLGRDI